MKARIIFILFTLVTTGLFSQKSLIKGRVTDSINAPIENVSVTVNSQGTVTDEDGRYELLIEGGKQVNMVFRHISYKTLIRSFRLQKGKTLNFSPRLYVRAEIMKEIILVDDDPEEAEGIIKVDAELAQVLPSANAGIESVLKTLPGVSFNNELSTAYNVRGGIFEENLVYVNGVEIYRPFLVRSGQQEGLSFVNPEMTQKVEFSAGGFQSKYGDKMSSVLDITYRKPERFSTRLEASFLGASALVEGLSKNERFKGLIGARYRNNSLLLNSTDVDANFNPNFTDVQTFLSYELSSKVSLDFLGSYALNQYEVTPVSRRTNFGTLSSPMAVVINYNGKEEDKYETLFGALSARYLVSDQLSLTFTASSYRTKEQEYYDIVSFYALGEVNSDFDSMGFGDPAYVESIGSQLDHARNDLLAQISNLRITGSWVKGDNHVEAGIKYQRENIKDRINEYQVIDSSGFSQRPPGVIQGNDEPYEPFTGPIIPFIGVEAENDVDISRISGFAQWSKKSMIGRHRVWYNIGVRAQHWTVSGEGITTADHMVVSPRGQFSIKPDWNKEMVFRISGGLYHQPPFYRELRDSLGIVRPEVEAQQAVHVVIGNDFSFRLWDKPFKLVTEAYYKGLTEVNPFTIDNVRIRYRARNNAVGYAAGVDLRWNGEFVPGTESWLSLGYLQTKENIDNRGYISRPTDQRFKVALLFQDYMPSVPSLRMYLNLVYSTGVPGGSPAYADPYLYQNRLKDYFRTDLGIAYVVVDAKNPPKRNWQKKFRELVFGLELFNMFDNQNTITNSWIRDVSSNTYVGIPNYLTGRVLNLKVRMHF